jgi:hypothetical protein
LSEHEQRTEEEVLEEQDESIEDLDAPDDEAQNASGGAWPKKYDGGPL